MTSERIGAYLATWLADHERRPAVPFVADAAAHEHCREHRLLVFEARGKCSRWWLTPEGAAIARANPRPVPPKQIELFA